MALTCHLVLLKVQEKLQFAPQQLRLELRVLYCVRLPSLLGIGEVWGACLYSPNIHTRSLRSRFLLPVWKGGILTIWFTCVRDQNFTV